MQETWIWPLDQEDPLEEEMATHTNIFAWKIPWRAEANITVHGVIKLGMTEPLTSFTHSNFMDAIILFLYKETEAQRG